MKTKHYAEGGYKHEVDKPAPAPKGKEENSMVV